MQQMISGAELEALTGLTDRRHRQIAKDGYFPAPVRGKYKTEATLQGLFKFFREAAKRDSEEIEAEKLRKITEAADALAIANEKSRGKLVEIEAVYKHFEGLFVSFRARILASMLTDQEKDELLNDLRKLKK